MFRGDISPNIALPSSYLRLAPEELSASDFLVNGSCHTASYFQTLDLSQLSSSFLKILQMPSQKLDSFHTAFYQQSRMSIAIQLSKQVQTFAY